MEQVNSGEAEAAAVVCWLALDGEEGEVVSRPTVLVYPERLLLGAGTEASWANGQQREAAQPQPTAPPSDLQGPVL